MFVRTILSFPPGGLRRLVRHSAVLGSGEDQTYVKEREREWGAAKMVVRSCVVIAGELSAVVRTRIRVGHSTSRTRLVK